MRIQLPSLLHVCGECILLENGKYVRLLLLIWESQTPLKYLFGRMVDMQDRFDTPGIHFGIGDSNQRFIIVVARSEEWA